MTASETTSEDDRNGGKAEAPDPTPSSPPPSPVAKVQLTDAIRKSAELGHGGDLQKSSDSDARNIDLGPPIDGREFWQFQRSSHARANVDASEKIDPLGTGPQQDWPQSAFDATRGDLRQVAFLLALATLSGEALYRIHSAALALQKRFETRAPKRRIDDKPFVLDVGFSLGTLLPQFRAAILPPGEGLPERGALINPTDGPRIVGYALSRISDITDDVRGWLLGLGEAADLETRIVLGGTVGVLAIGDFATVRAAFLEPWRTAKTSEPLDAFDAAMGVVSAHARDQPGLKRYIDEMLERRDRDDLFALGALAEGTFAGANPDCAFEILAALMSDGRWRAFALALRACLSWLDRGREDPKVAGRIWIELEKLSVKTDLEKYRKAHVVINLIGLASDDSDADLTAVFQANTEPPDALLAWGRLLNYVVFFPDRHVEGPPLRPLARETVRALFRAGLEHPPIRSVAWPLFRAAVEQGTVEQSIRLTELMRTWRSRASASQKDYAELSLP